MEQGIPENNSDTLESLKAQLEEAKKAQQIAEQRVKDTQGAYTKSRQSEKALEAKFKALQEHLNSIQQSSVLPEEIESLKNIDPEKYYQMRRDYELKTQQDLSTKIVNAEKSALEEDIKQYNAKLLADFLTKNPDITEDYINYEVPHRIQLKLQKGEVSFEQFLAEVESYHKKGTSVAKGSDVTNQPDLTKMGTGENVSNKALDYDSFIASYSKNII